MDTPTLTTTAPKADLARAYGELYERGTIDAAFFWLLRSIAVDQPHYTPGDLAEMEQRIDAQLDLLMSLVSQLCGSMNCNSNCCGRAPNLLAIQTSAPSARTAASSECPVISAPVAPSS